MTDLQKVGAYYKADNGSWTYAGFDSSRQNGGIRVATSKLGSFSAIEYHLTFADNKLLGT